MAGIRSSPFTVILTLVASIVTSDATLLMAAVAAVLQLPQHMCPTPTVTVVSANAATVITESAAASIPVIVRTFIMKSPFGGPESHFSGPTHAVTDIT